jgi:hypothetical protein
MALFCGLVARAPDAAFNFAVLTPIDRPLPLPLGKQRLEFGNEGEQSRVRMGAAERAGYGWYGHPAGSRSARKACQRSAAG